MTDKTPSTAPVQASSFGSEAALKRLKRRHAAERRFKLYGQIAIAIALSALLVLAWSIVSRAVPAFVKHEVAFSAVLDRDVITPAGRDGAEDIASNVSGFYSLVQKDLRQTFPEVEGDRLRTRALYSLVTRLGVLNTAKEVSRNPDLVGQVKAFTAPLSDDLDLYLKGGVTGRKSMDLSGTFAVTPVEEGQFELTGTDNQTLSSLLETAIGMGEAPSVLIKIDNTWFDTVEQTQSSLRLSHLAGPKAAPGVSINPASVSALILTAPETNRAVSNEQIAWTLLLEDKGRISRKFNADLFLHADSTYPELAGAAAAIVGSILTMLITASLAIPVGIFAAVYLEEFAPKNRLTDIVEVNINNLAAVPSIIFGLLGASVFLSFFGMPRSVPFVGGLVLSLLVLPTVIIASRAALKSVPPSIRTAALGLGASKTQAVFHHALPLAAPGILTGSIIAMARALGETAPLLLIGMVAFVNEVPTGPDQESTVLPVLIYKWFSGAERAWEPMTSAVIVMLLVFLILMNLGAVLLRRKFERRW
ncbi:MAG: hypothetical protein Hens3KO_25240 [Henriciella sp.]